MKRSWSQIGMAVAIAVLGIGLTLAGLRLRELDQGVLRDSSGRCWVVQGAAPVESGQRVGAAPVPLVWALFAREAPCD